MVNVWMGAERLFTEGDGLLPCWLAPQTTPRGEMAHVLPCPPACVSSQTSGSVRLNL